MTTISVNYDVSNPVYETDARVVINRPTSGSNPGVLFKLTNESFTGGTLNTPFTFTLPVVLSPTPSGTVNWTSSNTAVASVISASYTTIDVESNAEGTATLTCTSSDQGETILDVVDVTVRPQYF